MTKPLPYSKPLENFVKYFEGVAAPSERKFHRMSRVPVDFFVEHGTNGDFSINAYSNQMETVDAVALHIPIHKLPDLLAAIPEEHYREMEIRAAVPAVKKAYEQYKLLLTMCGGDFDARY